MDAFVEFLDASFGGKDVCKQFCVRFRESVPAGGDRVVAVAHSEDQLGTMRIHLTKLRLLAPREVLEA